MPSDSHTADAGKDGAQEPVTLGDRFEILPSQSIPALDGVAGPAFAARAVRGRKAECFAIICSGQLPPRIDATTMLLTIDNPGLIRFLDQGVIPWGPDGSRRLAMVFERPLGRRLRATPDAVADPMPEDQIQRTVMHSLVPVLKELAGRGITHGSIRPTNLFLREGGGGTGLSFGECASTPPGIGQPAVFETIERAMSEPAGRGTGSPADDLFAFAVTLMFLAFGRNPVQDLDDEALLAARIERGTYAALVGGVRIPTNLIEPLRGLLIDDPKQRWGLNQLDLWISGRRLSPKQAQLLKRASRPLEFAGQDCWHCRGLARLLVRNGGAAAILIDNGELDRWLRRGLSEDVLAESVALAADGTVGGAGKTVIDRKVARVAMTLDPSAPIRYRDKSVMPDGLAVALADAFLRRDGVQPLAEIVAWQLPAFWAGIQAEGGAELVPMVQAFDTLRGLLEKAGTGFGIERVLYEMNPYLHCLSPIVIDYRATSAAELLTALEAAAGRRDRTRDPFDRHIIAFIASRHRHLDDALFILLTTSADPVRTIAAMLTILADIQSRFAVGPLPALCQWLSTLMEPAFMRFHNRPHREIARRQVEKAATDGKLVTLLRCIDDPEAISKDATGFAAARRKHKAIVNETEKLRDIISKPDEITETTGRQVAAIIACVVGVLVAAVLCLMFLVK